MKQKFTVVLLECRGCRSWSVARTKAFFRWNAHRILTIADDGESCVICPFCGNDALVPFCRICSLFGIHTPCAVRDPELSDEGVLTDAIDNVCTFHEWVQCPSPATGHARRFTEDRMSSGSKPTKEMKSVMALLHGSRQELLEEAEEAEAGLPRYHSKIPMLGSRNPRV